MAQDFTKAFPQLYADWSAAGGPGDNFRAHVLAVNPPGLTITAEDVAWLLAHTANSFAQLQKALVTYGKGSGFNLKPLLVGQ